MNLMALKEVKCGKKISVYTQFFFLETLYRFRKTTLSMESISM